MQGPSVTSPLTSHWGPTRSSLWMQGCVGRIQIIWPCIPKCSSHIARWIAYNLRLTWSLVVPISWFEIASIDLWGIVHMIWMEACIEVHPWRGLPWWPIGSPFLVNSSSVMCFLHEIVFLWCFPCISIHSTILIHSTPCPSLGVFLPYGPHFVLSLTWQFVSSDVSFLILFQSQRREGLQISMVLLYVPQWTCSRSSYLVAGYALATLKNLPKISLEKLPPPVPLGFLPLPSSCPYCPSYSSFCLSCSTNNVSYSTIFGSCSRPLPFYWRVIGALVCLDDVDLVLLGVGTTLLGTYEPLVYGHIWLGLQCPKMSITVSP